MRSLLHFKPEDGHVGDVIPFYWDGVYHAFYLKRREGRGTPYAHAVSRDLVHWEEWPDAIETGPPGAPDHGNYFTGCVTERNGTFHLFYTGYTPNNPPLPRETVCHATSDDLITWHKDPANPILLSDETWYERDDWRDPFIFWNAEQACYWMLLCARKKSTGLPSPRAGCLALATSPDLVTWQVQPPLWAPDIVFAPECPDYWQVGDQHCLLFSNVETRYRAFEDWGQPMRFASTTGEALDTPRFYAAKAFHNGDRHLLAGWVSSNGGEKDAGQAEWGGTMGLLREMTLTESGEMHLSCPPEVRAAYTVPVLPDDFPLETISGTWEQSATTISAAAGDGMAFARLTSLPPNYRLSATFSIGGETATAGLVLRTSPALDQGYQLAIEPARQRVVVRPWQTWGDPPPTVERPLPLAPGEPATIELYLRGSILEIFLNDKVVLTSRVYDHSAGDAALWVVNGNVRIENLHVSVTEEDSAPADGK